MKRHIIRGASKNPFVSAITLANDVASTSGVQICAQSVRNVLHNAHIYGRSPRKKPLDTESRLRLRGVDIRVLSGRYTNFASQCMQLK
ncbi:hypothetical protein TNCV_4979451 [Trichonephila clavipes]|nr:hypothetical protein TNCV_4979451 [Trichonephila clavipes]